MAWHCELLRLALDLAREALSLAIDFLEWLKDIGAPQWMIDAAESIVNNLVDLVVHLLEAYSNCLGEHDSGGCDTGGCDTGGCGS